MWRKVFEGCTECLMVSINGERGDFDKLQWQYKRQPICYSTSIWTVNAGTFTTMMNRKHIARHMVAKTQAFYSGAIHFRHSYVWSNVTQTNWCRPFDKKYARIIFRFVSNYTLKLSYTTDLMNTFFYDTVESRRQGKKNLIGIFRFSEYSRIASFSGNVNEYKKCNHLTHQKLAWENWFRGER